MTYLKEIAAHPRIVAIGETGLDKLKGPSYDVQIPVFKEHIALSEKLYKPLIIHCVKAWDELINIYVETKPSQPWILHGYRGKPELTKRLIALGFYFSVGEDINVDSMEFIPIERIFCETDEDTTDIKEVYKQAAHAKDMDTEEFAEEITKNIHRIFPTLEAPKPFDPEEEAKPDD